MRTMAGSLQRSAQGSRVPLGRGVRGQNCMKRSIGGGQLVSAGCEVRSGRAVAQRQVAVAGVALCCDCLLEQRDTNQRSGFLSDRQLA
mmetsp:Transcript_35426/g.81157  ORF Transcript_35426/g.81157 Transcript_35426/m.81157 type:complete len:88 (-) Transcript_35426:291-554(-)